MKFKSGTRRRALEYEKDWVNRWKQDKTFEKSVNQRQDNDHYVFYDGPPFITGVPHHGTLLSSIVKDAVPRYWTMKGRRVERVWGWDTHGLPAENFVEKQLGITDRRQIVKSLDEPAPLDKYGNELPKITLEQYITKARESMVANAATWEDVVDRIGRWVDFQGAYKTMDKNFMESVWWAFKELYEKGKIYEGEKVLMYDTKFATPVSKNEVTMDNDAYQTVTDPSVYVKFKLKNSEKKSIILNQDSKVLFVCYANVNRSQMAKAAYNYLTNSDNAFSAGVAVDEIHPDAKTYDMAMEAYGVQHGGRAKKAVSSRYGVDIADAPRTQLQPKDLELYDLVVDITGPNDAPHWLAGDNVVHWDIEDTVGEDVDRDLVMSENLKELEARIKKLIGGKAVDDGMSSSYLLAWTTTPWTLPGNTALAVNPELDYFEVKVGDDNLILAKALVEKVLVDEKKQPLEYEVLRTMKGSELVGLSYEPLFGSVDGRVIKTISDKDFHQDAIDFDDTTSWTREASRAVLKDSNGNYALIHSKKYDYYKLPGGGIKEGESREDTLKRELIEEVGANAEVRHPIGSIVELCAFNNNQRQTSYAYYAEVVGEVGENSLEQDEIEEEFEVVWTGLDEAIRLIEGGNSESERGLGLRFMAYRDELILREYKKQLESNVKHDSAENAHKVWAADYVEAEAGTGIVHLAPIYGEEDFVLAQEKGIPKAHVLDDNGYYFPEVAEKLYKLMPWVDDTKPLEVWENNKNIAKGLEKAGVVWKIEYIQHEYPFNPRSGQRIMYRAIPSWFFDIQGSKPLMLEQNENVNWFPAHLKHGRFAKNIEQAPDWNLSRDRFWATAMPVWKGNKGTVKVVGSYAELKELSGIELEDYHRPWVDNITFEIDGEKFTRIDKVLDCWFESGSMPFAQFHYPFENKAKFEANFPGDFIVEYIGQVRAWFYYVHTVNTALFGSEAFKNVIVTGNAMGNDGRKLSKSLGNFTDPNEVMDKYSADSFRFLLLSSPLLNGEDFVLSDKDVGDVARKLSMVWNMYDFFTMYAEVDGWEYDGELQDPLPHLKNPLDIWIVSRLHQLVGEVEKHMDSYNLPDALSPILPFLDDASNWYVRRSRRRFWKSEDDGDKNDAYKTLHYVLVRLAYVLAPFTPFLAEELYHNLTGDKESIHLKDWLPAGKVNELVMTEMDEVRDIVNQGLSLRAKAGLKVRQPLASVTVPKVGSAFEWEPILLDELNVKTVKVGGEVAIDETITPELKREGLMREVIRLVQNARKDAGLNVDDRIVLALMAKEGEASELEKAIDAFSDVIKNEVLAVSFGDVQDGYDTSVKVDGYPLRICLKKA